MKLTKGDLHVPTNEFFNSRHSVAKLISTISTEYAILSIKDRIAQLKDETTMIRAHIGSAEDAIESIKLLPWICRGCGEYIYNAYKEKKTSLHWNGQQVICNVCYKKRKTVPELQHDALLKIARRAEHCEFCLNKPITAKIISDKHIGLCRSCLYHYEEYYNYDELKQRIDANYRHILDKFKFCVICGVDNAIRKIDSQPVCVNCYQKYIIRGVHDALITACIAWHKASNTGLVPKTKCSKCNRKYPKWIEGHILCFKCYNVLCITNKYLDMEQ